MKRPTFSDIVTSLEKIKKLLEEDHEDKKMRKRKGFNIYKLLFFHEMYTTKVTSIGILKSVNCLCQKDINLIVIFNKMICRFRTPWSQEVIVC